MDRSTPTRRRATRAVGATSAAVLLAAGGAWAASDGADVLAATVTGTRSFTLQGVGGGPLGDTTVTAGGSIPMAAVVTDARYRNVGYQVSATLSDLARLDPTAPDGVDCSTVIPAGAFTLGYLTDPVSVLDVEGLVSTATTLTADLSGALATLDPLGTLGIPAAVTLTDLPLRDQTLADAVDLVAGSSAALPIRVAAGSGGAFTDAAAHPTCAGGAPSPTSVLVMSGEANGALVGELLAWLGLALDDVEAAADTSGDGRLSAAELVAAGLLEQATVDAAVYQALLDAGVSRAVLDAPGSTVVSTVVGLLDTTSIRLGSLLGQSGVYTALLELVADDTLTQPTGVYGGRLEVTQVDLDEVR
ncbi:MAG: hypothetical protein ACLGIR_07950 [Actinomycetes bacterium]